MTTTDFKILEKIFMADIEAAMTKRDLPAQLKSKHLERLEKEGMIRRAEMTLGGRFPVTVQGWALTDRGHYHFCKECVRREPEGK